MSLVSQVGQPLHAYLGGQTPPNLFLDSCSRSPCLIVGWGSIYLRFNLFCFKLICCFNKREAPTADSSQFFCCRAAGDEFVQCHVQREKKQNTTDTVDHPGTDTHLVKKTKGSTATGEWGRPPSYIRVVFFVFKSLTIGG